LIVTPDRRDGLGAAQTLLEHDLRAIIATGAGVMILVLIGPTSVAAIVAAVLEGDAAARLTLAAAVWLLRQNPATSTSSRSGRAS